MSVTSIWHRAATAALPYHRSYRRLPRPKPVPAAILVVVVVVAEAFLWTRLADLGTLFVRIAQSLLPGYVSLAPVHPLAIGQKQVLPLAFAAESPSQHALLLWVIGAMLGMAVVPLVRRVPSPVRSLIFYNLLILVISALWLLATGTVGYTAGQFSGLYLLASMLTWVVLPVLIGALCFSFPAWEGALLITLTVTYVYLFSAVRYAAFAALCALVGNVLLANMYLFFGPLLDFALTVAIFSYFLPRFARRVPPDAWRES